MLFDDKTGHNAKSIGYTAKVITTSYPEITFTASYVVLSDLLCHGKIDAHFNLIVLGNLTAVELDVKGKFVCLGKCSVENKITVGGSIVAGEITAGEIEVQETITARELDVRRVKAKEQIVITKTLSVEELVQSVKGVLCGETIFSSGKIDAKILLTAEEPDLDGGIIVKGKPYIVGNSMTATQNVSQPATTVQENPIKAIKTLIARGEYRAINDILQRLGSTTEAKRISSYLSILQKAQAEVAAKKPKLISFLRLIEVVNDECFVGAANVERLLMQYENLIEPPKEEKKKQPFDISAVRAGQTVEHKTYGDGIITERVDNTFTVRFQNGTEKKFILPAALPHIKINVPRSDVQKEPQAQSYEHIELGISAYSDFIEAISLLRKYGGKLSAELFKFSFEAVYEKIGVKTHFLDREFTERGWRKHGE
jgi:hypothetical protein